MSYTKYIAALFFGVLLVPVIVLAAPLTGADDDVDFYVLQQELANPEWIVDTDDANDSDTDGDVQWSPGGGVMRPYIGNSEKFERIYFDVFGTSFASFGTLKLYYWDGSAYQELEFTSNTDPFMTEGVNYVAFTPPEDWAQQTVTGTTAYFITFGDDMDGFGSGCSNKCGGAQVSQISLLLASGGGGGGEESVPEFSTYIYLLTLLAGSWYIYTIRDRFALQKS